MKGLKAMSEQTECFGCPNLKSKSDAAGGGTYSCELYPGIVLGEWGHWTDENDTPRRLKDCPQAG